MSTLLLQHQLLNELSLTVNFSHIPTFSHICSNQVDQEIFKFCQNVGSQRSNNNEKKH